MRFLVSVIIFFTSCFGVYWAWNHSSLRHSVADWVDSGNFVTLEVRFTPEQIMEEYRLELLKSPKHKFLPARLTFHPYIMFDVKYSDDQKATEEGVVVWGMTSGEMVLDTSTWEMTHGYEDCLLVGAGEREYRVINLLAKHNGVMDHDKLKKSLGLDGDELESALSGVLTKKLVVRHGNQYRLHFEKPKLNVKPNTVVHQSLVTKPYKHATRSGKRFSQSQLEKNAAAVFGNDFAIRGAREIYLPVYRIDVQNPDGSVMTTHWNALNGKRMENRFSVQ